jgi:hypothetical protein
LFGVHRSRAKSKNEEDDEEGSKPSSEPVDFLLSVHQSGAVIDLSRITEDGEEDYEEDDEEGDSLTQIFPVHCQFQVSSLLINRSR